MSTEHAISEPVLTTGKQDPSSINAGLTIQFEPARPQQEIEENRLPYRVTSKLVEYACLRVVNEGMT